MVTKTRSIGHDAMYGRWVFRVLEEPASVIFKIESTYQTKYCRIPADCSFNVVKFTAVRTFDFPLSITVFTKASYWM